MEKGDAVLDSGTNTLPLQADNDEGEEEAVASDLVQVDAMSLNDKMGALEEDVHSIKADVKATNNKMEALDEKMEALETKLGSVEGMMTHIVKLLEASGDVEEEAGDGTTN